MEIEYHPMIRDLPADDRPRERLQQLGPEALSTAELLAIIMRTGLRDENVVRMSERLLHTCGGITGLGRARFEDLCEIKGLGPAKATELKAVFELGKRYARATPNEKPTVKSPADAANLLMADMRALEQEHLRTIILDTRNQVLKIHTVYIGTLNTTGVRVGELFREAIRLNAAALIVAHNHPSGDPTPSVDDIHVTRQLVEAGKLLSIDVLDHVVIGEQRWVSLKERGLGF